MIKMYVKIINRTTTNNSIKHEFEITDADQAYNQVLATMKSFHIEDQNSEDQNSQALGLLVVNFPELEQKIILKGDDAKKHAVGHWKRCCICRYYKEM